MATKANLTIDQGSNFNIDVVLTDENDDPIDINNYEINSKLRKWYTANAEVSFTVTPHPEFNLFSMSLAANQTSSLTAGRYVYDVELTETNTNEIIRIVEGVVTISPEVTR